MIPKTVTLSDMLRDAAGKLRAAGVDNAMADARILAAAALSLTREDMLREPHLAIERDGLTAFDEMIGRRCAREPVARILGRREFRSLEFRLGPDTLDPRPDSETIVEVAVEYGKDLSGPVRVLDIGTGTGCLLISVLNELPGATGIGTDIAAGAVKIAACNASLLGMSERAAFVRTNWADGVNETFDLVLSNPPYIETAEVTTLVPEVSGHDPVTALDGGTDGLDAYRALADRLGLLLSPDGAAILEIGATQREVVSQIFSGRGFPLVETRADFGGHARGLVFAAGPVSKWLTRPGKKELETP